jgi:hypothetical protein
MCGISAFTVESSGTYVSARHLYGDNGCKEQGTIKSPNQPQKAGPSKTQQTKQKKETLVK